MAAHLDHDGGRRVNRLRPAIWGIAGLLLLLPLVAMQFTAEVNWTGRDFVAFGVLLAVACGTYEFGAWLSGNTRYRAAVGVAVLTGFLLVWVNLAVGFIGSERNPANLMFGGVLAVGIIGALVARFRAQGMARALAATAAAQVLVSVIALIGHLGDTPLIPTAVFAALWMTSAWLFHGVAEQQSALDAAA
jgi:hypothetical protein